MESEKDLIKKKLFIKEEDVLRKLDELLSRVANYVKIEEETGEVLFQQPDLTIEQKIFLLLTAKYFRHKVNEKSLETATITEMSKSLEKPQSSLSWQLDKLIQGSFITRISKGTYMVNYYKIEGFLDEIEKSKGKKGFRLTDPI